MADQQIITSRNCLVYVAPAIQSIQVIYGAELKVGGEKLITSITNAPVITSSALVESSTAADLGLEKSGDVRYYLGGYDTGEYRENTSSISGSITVDLSTSSTGIGYDEALDVLKRAATEQNKDLYVQMDIFMNTQNALGYLYYRRAAVVKVMSKATNTANSGQTEETFQLKGSGAFAHGYIYKL